MEPGRLYNMGSKPSDESVTCPVGKLGEGLEGLACLEWPRLPRDPVTSVRPLGVGGYVEAAARGRHMASLEQFKFIFLFHFDTCYKNSSSCLGRTFLEISKLLRFAVKYSQYIVCRGCKSSRPNN